MIQLSFQPAFDPFHGAFRLFRLWPTLKRSVLPRDAVRILDFYLMFPFRIEGIRLKAAHAAYRKLAATYSHTRPYGEQPEDRTVFARMEPIQDATFETLSVYGMIDSDQLALRRVQVTPQPIPAEVAARVDEANARDIDLMRFIGVLAADYQLSGKNGLKDRTGLLEYRYDAG